MADENRNGLSEAVETGAGAARTIQGAIKTGKAISAAAKGAATGGPYGAVAGAVWAGRKHIGKVIAAITVLLLLPVLFVLLLPSLIFGGLTDAFSSIDPDVPILNSSTVIVENANNISFTVSGVLNEGLADVLERIQTDFDRSDGDQMDVVNPYASNPIYNANLLASQYCAAHDMNFENISLSDMEAVLRRGIQHLYSYKRTEELRETTETDPDTGEETTVTEKWMIYTVVYNGESYFADTIFALTDEQKVLAADYAENLSLFLGDGIFQNLSSWNGTNSIPSLGDVRFTDGITPVVYYNQLDERYAGQPYGTDNIGGYACGPTAMSIVVSSLSGDTVNPVEMAKWAYDNGYWCKGSGSYHALIPATAKAWGLPVSGCTASEPQRILDALAEGKLVVAIMSKGHFTSSGHFIVLRGVKDEQIMVADPASYTRSEQLWDLSLILNEASRGAAAGGPFWIVG
ncbi:MAG: C39 family peptidase [Clostridiaceae bacterium]|nr:C39 family peptidase [Clostridiaceae bacterium]